MSTKVPTQNAIFNALERAIKPIIRLMLAKGITYVQLTEWLKHIFIETALEQFETAESKLNDSRLSVLTGVHRKDIKRLKSIMTDHKINEEPASVNLGSQIVSIWLSNPQYMENGRPKALPRYKTQAGDNSFEALAELVTKDVRARAIIDELERLGAVSINQDDQVILVEDAFIPTKGEVEKTYYFGLGVGDHANASVSNLLNIHPPFFDRVVHYTGLSNEAIQAIEQTSREQGNALLLSINKEAEELAHQKQSGPTKRFTLGVYLYIEDDQHE
jgi:hypothetical protein